MPSRFTKSLAVVALLGAASSAAVLADTPILEMTTDIPAAITAPDALETSIGTLEFADGVPSTATVDTVYDYLDRSRAVQVFLNAIPALSIDALRAGQAAAGCVASHQICIFDQLMDSASLLLTGNTSTMYAVGFLDLAKDGPTVIDLPPGMLGVLDDAAFKYITDLGAAGPDKGKGGKFLILPPGYDGEVPDGYFVFHSETNIVWNFMRGYLDKGIEAASNNIRDNLKVYPLAMADSPPAMTFVDVSGMNINTVLPNDVTAFERLHALIQDEPDEFLGPEAKGMMAAIGIEKGTPFAPDDRMQAILTDAAAIGNAAARSITYAPRYPGVISSMARIAPGSWPMRTRTRPSPTRVRINLDARILFHFGYIVVSPAMAVTVAGKGSDYAMAMLDSEKRPLDGAKTYKLTIPADPPVKDFWAITMYDTQTRSQLQTDQQFPTLGSQSDGFQQNTDGSFDVYFGPSAPDGQAANWLQTVPGKGWFIALRMYGPEQAWIDQSWRPGEIELVQ